MGKAGGGAHGMQKLATMRIPEPAANGADGSGGNGNEDTMEWARRTDCEACT